jgi:hypothetical protein
MSEVAEPSADGAPKRWRPPTPVEVPFDPLRAWLGEDLLPGPCEPVILKLHCDEVSSSSPLGLRVVALSGNDISSISSAVRADPWISPHSLAVVRVPLPELLDDVERQAVLNLIMARSSFVATLVVPRDAGADPERRRLQTLLRYDAHGGATVEIPVPGTTTLRRGSTIVFSAVVFGVPATIIISAAGHIHTATCFHRRVSAGDAWAAAARGDADLLVELLSAGRSTEEINRVRTGNHGC